MINLLTLAVTAQAQQTALSGDKKTEIFKAFREIDLQGQRDRFVSMSQDVLQRIRGTNEPQRSMTSQEIAVQAASAAFQNAKLEREIRELGVKEYEQGVSVQETATAEGAIQLAESEIKRAEGNLSEYRELLERVNKAASRSVYDMMAVFQCQNMVKATALAKRKAELELEQARIKLKLLREFEQPKRLRELRSEVERARADELRKKQERQLEEDKLSRMKQDAAKPSGQARFNPILKALAEAARLEGEVRTKLADLTPSEQPSQEERRKEISALDDALEAKLREAERVLKELKFTELAADIRSAAGRMAGQGASQGDATGGSILEKFRKIAPEDQARLKAASPQERSQILRKAGFTDEELQRLERLRESARPQ
jgi:hypothetical protein